MPMEDPKNDLTGSFEVIGNEVKFTVTRKADTGDSKDYLIQGGKTTLCAYAINPLTSDKRSIHSIHNRW